MADLKHLEWLEQGREFWQKKRSENDFRPDFSGAVLSGIRLTRFNLEEANFRRAKLDGCDLRETDLHSCDFTGADLKKADLRGAELGNANLSMSALSHADLRFCSLVEAVCKRTNFFAANISEGNFHEFVLAMMKFYEEVGDFDALNDSDPVSDEQAAADVIYFSSENRVHADGARFYKCDVRNADLSGLLNLSQDDLDSCYGNYGTVPPSELEAPHLWKEQERSLDQEDLHELEQLIPDREAPVLRLRVQNDFLTLQDTPVPIGSK